MSIIYVALGGAAGSVLRFVCQRYSNTTLFPAGTLLVNIAGCFLIGVLWALWVRNSLGNSNRLLLMTGFCGGFTTFSAFTQESMQMLVQNKWLPLLIYISISVVGGLLATFAGYKLII